jgi:surfactin synthase thioesterase subunit
MWLRDALPKDIPTARIIIYGYKSTIAGSTSIQNLEDLATSFYNSLLPLARSETPRPIIIIGHSLGGLIVKQVRKFIITI